MNHLIATIDFFSGLDNKILKKISALCIVRQFARNEIIVRQGQTGLGLYMISRGRVKVEREQDGARTQVAELGPDQSFGEMSLLDDRPQGDTMTAIEDTECLVLRRESFVTLMDQYPDIPIRMARVLAERLRVSNEKLDARPSDGIKSQIRNKLVETFQGLYALKALSRFSIAVLGCPVEGFAANTVEQIRVGDVKALFFPAHEPVDMRIAAGRPGSFTLDVFTPFRPAPYHFGPVAVGPSDLVKMTLTSRRITLRNGVRDIPFF
jgi:CRP-like cAMP-binding protein